MSCEIHTSVTLYSRYIPKDFAFQYIEDTWHNLEPCTKFQLAAAAAPKQAIYRIITICSHQKIVLYNLCESNFISREANWYPFSGAGHYSFIGKKKEKRGLYISFSHSRAKIWVYRNPYMIYYMATVCTRGSHLIKKNIEVRSGHENSLEYCMLVSPETFELPFCAYIRV